MPLYMDRHDGMEDATPFDVAAAHARDIEAQQRAEQVVSSVIGSPAASATRRSKGTSPAALWAAAVQLAARVCSTCEGGEILVSGAVRELCLGKGITFADRGVGELKGFDEPVHVWGVTWSPDSAG